VELSLGLPTPDIESSHVRVCTVMARCKSREYVCKSRKVGNNRSRLFVCFTNAAMNIQNLGYIRGQ
jgi:hypothetical protein